MSLNSSSTLISQLIEKFQLISHPEGGYYAETYRSNQTIRFNTTNNQELERNASTAIYFLITPGSCSRLHRLTSDEGKITAHLNSSSNKNNNLINTK